MSVVASAVYSSKRVTSRSPVKSDAAGTAFVFNGVDQYATHTDWSPLGDPTVYVPSITYQTSNEDGYVVDATTFPISEFGRVGANYHSGTIKNLNYVDVSPLSSRTGAIAFLCSANRQIQIPDINLKDAVIEFDFQYNTGDQAVIGGSVSIISIVSDVIQFGVNVTAIELDGSSYTDAALVDGRHYHIKIWVATGTLRYMSGLCAYGNLSLINQE